MNAAGKETKTFDKSVSKVIDPVILNFLPARLLGGVTGSQLIVCQIPK